MQLTIIVANSIKISVKTLVFRVFLQRVFGWRQILFVLENSANRMTCLCKQQQNFTMEFKMLKTHNKSVPTNSDVFLKYIEEKVISILANIK